MAQLILSQIEGQSLYKVYVQPGQEYLLYGKVTTPVATSTYTLREVSVTGQVLTNQQTTIATTAGLQEFSKVFTTSGATVMLIIALANAEVLELSLDGPPGVVLITTPVEKTLRHVSQFDVLISYLDYAFEVKISRKLNGNWQLTFALPLDDAKGQELVNENFIEYDGQKYVIKAIKDDDVKKVRMVEAEHVGLGLMDYWLADTLDLPSVSATVALAAVLEGTPYTVGTVNVTGSNNFEAEIMNKLAAVKKVVDTWGGELDFDNYEVSLLEQMGQDNGIQFRKGKNLSGIVRTLDTKTLITKMYGYGKDNLVITGMDTTGWTDEQKAGLTIVDDHVIEPFLVSDNLDSYAKEYQGEFRDSDIEGQQELLTAMREALAEQEIPRVTYEVSVVDLSGLAQYVGEGFGLGDTVKVIDEDLSIDVQARIVEYDKYPFEPWRDKAVLANFSLNLHDYLSQLSAMKETYDRFVTKGKVSTAWLEGIINTLVNQIVASGAYASAQVIEGKGIILENTDPGSPDFGALYLGPGIFAIADSKLGNGTWNWRTFGTGSGFTADLMVTGKLLTSLVEIVGEAVEGESKFYWDATGLYAVDPDNANRYMVLTKEGLRGFVDGVLRLHLGPYDTDKFGLLVRASDGATTILDEDGIMQTWQDSRSDNLDASHPLLLNIYLPAETREIKQALLRFRLQAFRAYETSASSGGGSTSGSSSINTTDSEDENIEVTGYVAIPGGTVDNTDDEYASADDHNHGISEGTSLALDGGGSVTYHEFSGGSHAHWLYNHGHYYTAYGHAHGMSHTHTTPNHAHGLAFGIYESTPAANVTITINGVNRTAALGGPFNTDQSNLNISPYLLADQWNTIELGTSQLGRIDATIFIQALMGV